MQRTWIESQQQQPSGRCKNDFELDSLQHDGEHEYPSNKYYSSGGADTPKGLSQLYVTLTTLFYSVLIVVGLTGNSLVVATLSRWRELRTPCNLLIASICAADLGVCLLAAPLRIIEIYRGWLFGEVLCYILTPLQEVFVVVSVITQTVIALERHRAIVAPFKPKMTLHRAKMLVPIIWVACYVTSAVPMLIFLENKLFPNGYFFCFPFFPRDGYRIAYEIYLVVLFITLPLVLQSAAYFNVIRALRAENEMHWRSYQPNNSMKKTLSDRAKQKKRLVRMLIVLMLAFQVCYLPRGVIMLIQEFSPVTTAKPEFTYVELITLAMYYLKHVVNPIILSAMSNDFRSGCLSVCAVDDSHLAFIRGNRHSTSLRGNTRARRLQRNTTSSSEQVQV